MRSWAVSADGARHAPRTCASARTARRGHRRAADALANWLERWPTAPEPEDAHERELVAEGAPRARRGAPRRLERCERERATSRLRAGVCNATRRDECPPPPKCRSRTCPPSPIASARSRSATTTASRMRVISYEWVVREEANGDKIVVDLSCGHTRGRYYALSATSASEPDGDRLVVVADERRAAAERAVRALQQARVRGVRRAQARRCASRPPPAVRRASCAANTRPAAERTSATCGVRAIARRT